jgi:hypothetical protein
MLGPNKTSLERIHNRLNGEDLGTKFEYPDSMMIEYMEANTPDQDSTEVINTVNLLKELIKTKTFQITKFEREMKSREEKLSQRLNELSIDQFEKFSDQLLNKRGEEVEKFMKHSEPTYKIEKFHFDYYFNEIQAFLSFLKKNSMLNSQFEEEKKSEADMKRSQTNRNLFENKITTNDAKSPTNSKANLNNSIVVSKPIEQGTKIISTDMKNPMKPNNNNVANTKLNSSLQANSKSPSSVGKPQPVTKNDSILKKPSGTSTNSNESSQNLNNFKNSQSAVKNPAVIDPKMIMSNKSLLASVENIKKLEEIETHHDNLMLKNDDDLLVDSGFDSDKDNRELYELKRRERLRNKQNPSVYSLDAIPETESSVVDDNKKKLIRSLSNLGPSVRNFKNLPSDSNNSIASTPSNPNITNNTSKTTYSKGVESKTSVDFYRNNNINDLNSSLKMVYYHYLYPYLESSKKIRACFKIEFNHT